MRGTVTAIVPTGIYSTDDVCALLDMSPHALAEARRSGELRSARKGRRILYLGEWILAWLRAGREAACE